MIRIWPRRPHEVQTSSKRRTDDHDVAAGEPTTSPATQSSRAHRYTKGGSLDSRYSGDAAKSYPHLVYTQPQPVLVPFVQPDAGSRQRSQQQQQHHHHHHPQQQQPQPQQQQQQTQQQSSSQNNKGKQKK
jgi:hypothetical protein